MQEQFSGNGRPHLRERIGTGVLLKLIALVIGVGAGIYLLLGSNRLSAATLKALQEAQLADVNAENIQYPSGGDLSIKAFRAEAKAGGKHPGVIIVHSNQGLDASAQDLARHFAAEGFVALAPDLLSRPSSAGGGNARTVAELSAEHTVDDVKAAFEFLSKDPEVDADKISAVGLGWGGWRVYRLAEETPKLHRAVIYYGSTPMSGLENIHTPVLAHYAQYDFRITGNAIWTANTINASGKKFSYYIYPGADAAFINKPDEPDDAKATELSWKRTLDFLRS